MSRKNVLTRSKKLKAEELLNCNALTDAHRLLTQVCQADRSDPEAWTLLAIAERKLGNSGAAEQASRRAVQLNPRYAPAHQTLGTALQSQGRLAEAIASYRKAIELQPSRADTHYLLGNALREAGALLEADANYARATALAPDFVAALSNRGALLIALGKPEEAKRCLLQANRIRPGLPQVLCNIAVVLQSEGKFDEAKAYCRDILRQDPNFLDALVLLAELAEKSPGEDNLGELVERGLALDPDNLNLNMTAARIARRENRAAEGISRLERLLTKVPEAWQCDILLLLGQLYDKQKDTDRAFHCLSEGNRLKARTLLQSEDDSEHYLKRIEELRQRFRAEKTWSPPVDDDFDDSPVFLLGFPRSGTTLLEQILDSHPRLQALEERPTVSAMEQAFRRITEGRPQPYGSLTLDEVRQLRKVYFDTVAHHMTREPGRILVDKLPLNTVQAHFIWRIFPKAKFILAIRHPCDVCLSCFMQNFALNQAMATFFSLEKTAEAYAGVMSLWQEYIGILPIDYHRIRYEDLVADNARETQRLLEFLGLEWNESVLRHDEHARTRGINTPSYHQVTQPIYQDAKYRWKRYEKHLAGILPVLQPYVDYFDYRDQPAG